MRGFSVFSTFFAACGDTKAEAVPFDTNLVTDTDGNLLTCGDDYEAVVGTHPTFTSEPFSLPKNDGTSYSNTIVSASFDPTYIAGQHLDPLLFDDTTPSALLQVLSGEGIPEFVTPVNAETYELQVCATDETCSPGEIPVEDTAVQEPVVQVCPAEVYLLVDAEIVPILGPTTPLTAFCRSSGYDPGDSTPMEFSCDIYRCSVSLGNSGSMQDYIDGNPFTTCGGFDAAGALLPELSIPVQMEPSVENLVLARQ